MPLEEIIFEAICRIGKVIDIAILNAVNPVIEEETRQFYFDDLFSLQYVPDLSKGTVFSIFHLGKIPPMVGMGMFINKHSNLLFDCTDIVNIALYSQPDIYHLWHPNGSLIDLRKYEAFPNYRQNLGLVDFPLFSTNNQKVQIAREALNTYDDQVRTFKEESLLGIFNSNLRLCHNLNGETFNHDIQRYLLNTTHNFFSMSEFIISYERLRFQGDLTVAADFNPAFFDEALQLISNR